MFKSTRMLAEAGIMVGLSLALWYLNLGQLPQGGSISLQMLPLFVFSLRWGAGPGIVVGVAYGLLHSMQDMFVVHPLQYLLDYPIAFGLIGLSGLVRNLKITKTVSVLLAIIVLFGGIALQRYTVSNVQEINKQTAVLQEGMASGTATAGQIQEMKSQIADLNAKSRLFAVGGYVVLISSLLAFVAILYGTWKRTYSTPVEFAVLIGGLGRFVSHLLSGYIFFGQYVPQGMNPWVYSMVYNFLVVAPSTLLSLAVILMIWPSLEKASHANVN
ncbi:energy-coupled thiamine transporter ThiT [Coprothermobacter platensis]|uniref:energy-coupled thiamine transporter ThiT n=1 Tax=Coprothermobacter platensis TaxID=108819 RepID=UPI00037C22D5|nr:energy-coupled thiamine transporter ThiT [Coprothermobacter platensis]